MNILFVCTGNTCRSPMAEGYLKSKALNGVFVDSCGFSANGLPVSDYSALVMKECGIDISAHKSKTADRNIIDWADKIICMSEEHKKLVSVYFGESCSEISVLGIPDPYGGDENTYRNCRALIFAALDDLIEKGFFSDFAVETAAESDLNSVASLEAQCFSQPWSEKALLEAYRHGTLFLTAKRGKELLGYIGMNIVLDEGYITDIAVSPEYRRKGVATALLKALLASAEKKKLSFVSLEVRHSNRIAIELYSKLGFICEGERRDFYREPREDALILTKRF